MGQLYASGFSRRALTWMFIQTVVFVIAGVTAYQTTAIPYLDPFWGDTEQHGHLVHGEHTCPAQPIIARHQPVRFVFAGPSLGNRNHSNYGNLIPSFAV